ncbi:UNVERIFIED_CONTAM: Dehydrogenase/reductase SDR family member 7 [Trichonephila clavipes]
MPVNKMAKLENSRNRNKVIWITGASSGIGEYLAYSLIKHHARLALSGVNVERLEAVRNRCLRSTSNI